MRRFNIYAALLLILVSTAACKSGKKTDAGNNTDCEYARDPLIRLGSSPCLTFFEGKYYYCQSSYVKVSLRCSGKLNDLYNAPEHTIFYSCKDHQISAPRLYHLDDAWYIYYSSDDGDLYFVYHAFNGDPAVNRSNRCPRIQKWSWDENGIPALGTPDSGSTPLPSWEQK